MRLAATTSTTTGKFSFLSDDGIVDKFNSVYLEETSETTPKFLEASNTTCTDSQEVVASREAAISPRHQTLSPDIKETEQPLSKSVNVEDELKNESLHSLTTEFAPDKQIVATIAAEPPPLRVVDGYNDPFFTTLTLVEDIEQMPAPSCSNEQQSLQVPDATCDAGEQHKYGDNEAQTLVEGLVPEFEEPACPLMDTTESTGVQMLPSSGLLPLPLRPGADRENYDFAPSSDVNLCGTASPTDTVATSIAEVPASTSEASNNDGLDFQSADVPSTMEIDSVNKLGTHHGASGQPKEAVDHTQAVDGDIQMTDTGEDDQHVTKLLLLTIEENAEVHGFEPSTTFNATSPAPSPTQEIYDIEDTHQEDDGSPDDQTLHQMVSSPTPTNTILGNDTESVRLSPTSATNQDGAPSQAAQSPLQRAKLEDFASDDVFNESTPPADAAQEIPSMLTPTTKVTDLASHGESAPTPELVTAEEGPLVSTTVPMTPPPEIDIASTVPLPRIHMPYTMNSDRGLKRSFDSAGFIHMGKGPPAKKRKLSSHSELVDVCIRIDDLGDVDVDALQVVQQSSAQRIVDQEMRDDDKVTTPPDVHHYADVAIESAAASGIASSGPMEADPELQVDDLATTSTPALANETCPKSVSTPSRETRASEEIEQHDSNDLDDVQLSEPEVHPPQFTGPFVQITDADMQQRITTASLSPPLGLQIPTPKSTTEPRSTRITFKPLHPLTTPKKPCTFEMTKTEGQDEDTTLGTQLADTDTSDSEPLSEADSEDLLRLLLADKPIAQVKGEEDLSPSDEEEVDADVASKDSTPSSVSSSSTDTQPTALHREIEFHYGRRATRSETKTMPSSGEQRRNSDLDSVASHGGWKEVKREAADADPSNPSTTTRAIQAGGQKPKLEAEALQRRDDVAATKNPSIPGPKSTSKTAVQRRTPRLKAHAETVSSSKPSPRASPTSPARKRKRTPAVQQDDSVSQANSDEQGKPTRMTRRASAVAEEEKEKAAVEGNIGRRLRRR